MATAGPGWYQDPDDPTRQRWWDGSSWGPAAPPTGGSSPIPPVDTVTGRPPEPSTERARPLAVTSLVLAALWLFGIGSAIAILTGVVALRRTPDAISRNLAIAGTVTGGIGLAILLPLTLAVGIPLYLDQQDREIVATVTADVHAGAVALESELFSTGQLPGYNGVPPAQVAPSFEPSDDVLVILAEVTEADFCLMGYHSSRQRPVASYRYSENIFHEGNVC